MLQGYGKRQTLANVEQAVAALQRAGIVVIVGFMVGAPEESRETARRSMELARRLKSIAPVILHLTTATPYPGTRWERRFAELGLLPPGFEAGDPHGGAVLGTAHLTADQVSGLRREFLREFYTSEYVKTLSRLEPHARIAAGFAEEAAAL